MAEHGEKTPGTIGQIDSGELPGDTVGEGVAREAWAAGELGTVVTLSLPGDGGGTQFVGFSFPETFHIPQPALHLDLGFCRMAQLDPTLQLNRALS